MSRPTWATTVGIIGIILGCLGLMGGVQFMTMPAIMDMQKEMFSQMQKEFEKQATSNSQQAPPSEVFKIFEKMWNMPEWYRSWCVVAGVIALFVCGFYIFASIRLLQTKPTAIKIFYAAAGTAIVFSVVKLGVALAAMSFMGLTMAGNGLIGIVINIILLIVVATGDKTAFLTQSVVESPSQYPLP
ncbi:MAG: hypothetical protein JW709_04915 [Sedimentisphaerales bacterium]|nr:hypothetical protein [Sedimentisphaerales bacterium]